MENEERLSKIKDILSKMPFNPGVYMLKDKDGKIIYIGKAISLRKRVRQYFQKTRKTERILKMATLVEDIEYIIVDNEKEALILENNLIKENMPKFNVLLKDDKTYPYIKITMADKYPMIYLSRSIKNDGAKYFGPYANVGAARESIKIIHKIFPIKRCKQDFNKLKKNIVKGPCLYYHINKCLGPCINDINRDEYIDMMKQVCMFLDGKHNDIQISIKEKIQEYSKNLEFEKAGRLKESLEYIDEMLKKQDISNISENDADIIGLVDNKSIIYMQIFKIRHQKIVERDSFVFDNIGKEEIGDIMPSILLQYYEKRDIPPKVILGLEFEDKTNVENILSERKGSSVKVQVTKQGTKNRLVKMVENNIYITLEERTNNLERLQSVLGLDYEIQSIEAYDISNLRNDYIVGAMVRLDDGKLNKKMYRKFKIRSTLTQDDPQCIYEVIKRRLAHDKEWKLPDIILVDGGKTQLNKAYEAIMETGNLDIKVYGMVKNDKHKTRGLLDKEGKDYIIDDRGLLNFITFIQEEIHRFVIKYHRQLRDKIYK